MTWDGQVVSRSEEGTNNNWNDKNGHLSKIKDDSSLDWIYDVPGHLEYSIVSDAAFDEDRIYVAFTIRDGIVYFDENTVEVNINPYSSQIHVLDKATGQ